MALYKGTINPRGPYYDVLKYILDVDHDLETLIIKTKLSVKIAHDFQEYEKNIASLNTFVEKLFERDVDIFTFVERKWCCPISEPPSTWIKEDDNVGLVEIKDMRLGGVVLERKLAIWFVERKKVA